MFLRWFFEWKGFENPIWKVKKPKTQKIWYGFVIFIIFPAGFLICNLHLFFGGVRAQILGTTVEPKIAR